MHRPRCSGHQTVKSSTDLAHSHQFGASAVSIVEDFSAHDFLSPAQTDTDFCICLLWEGVRACVRGHFCSSLTPHPLLLWFQQGQILRHLVLLIIQDEMLCPDQQGINVYFCLQCLEALGEREKLVFRLAPE